MRSPAANAVQVWLVQLDDFLPLRDGLAALLAPEESARAQRFHFPVHADHFTLCRGLLRTLLADYLGAAPTALEFHYGHAGKPVLAEAQNPQRLTFNLSHSGGVAVIAVTRGAAVGVDVEQVDKALEVDQLARRVLSGAEREWLYSVADGKRRRAFLRFWTHKEAYVKARGEGLGAPLAEIEVQLPTDGLRARLTDRRHAGDTWALHELSLEREYVGALAVACRDPAIEQTRLTPPQVLASVPFRASRRGPRSGR